MDEPPRPARTMVDAPAPDTARPRETEPGVVADEAAHPPVDPADAGVPVDPRPPVEPLEAVLPQASDPIPLIPGPAAAGPPASGPSAPEPSTPGAPGSGPSAAGPLAPTSDAATTRPRPSPPSKTVLDGATEAEVPAPASAAKRRRRFVLLGVAVGVPAFLIGVALAAHGPIVRSLVKSRAAALGIDLDFDELDAGFGRVRLTHAHATLKGVPGLHIGAVGMTLETSGLTVTSVDAESVTVALEGPAAERVLDLAAWSGAHAETFHVPGTARDVQLEWRARPRAPAWLAMKGGTLTGDGKNGQLSATTTAFGVPMGEVTASVAVEATGVTIEAGKKHGMQAPIVATLYTQARPPTFAVQLRPVEASALGTALGVTLPAHAGILSARVDLTLASPAMTGSASVEIDGWVPQHPKVLDGMIYGKKTTLRSRLTLTEDHAAVKLEDLEVKAGKLVLKGSGSMAEEGNRTMLRLDVGGPIPCTELARATATNELPGLLGEIAGEVAGRTVGGSAVVNVSVEADARNLGAAKITPKVSVGCALKLPRL